MITLLPKHGGKWRVTILQEQIKKEIERGFLSKKKPIKKLKVGRMLQSANLVCIGIKRKLGEWQ
jgi:hypothetical protein